MNVQKPNQITLKTKTTHFPSNHFLFHPPQTQNKIQIFKLHQKKQKPKNSYIPRETRCLPFTPRDPQLHYTKSRTNLEFSIYFGGVKNSTDLDSNYRLFGEEPTLFLWVCLQISIRKQITNNKGIL